MIGGLRMVRNLDGSGRGLIEALFRHLPVEKEENEEKSVKIVGVLIEIRTQNLPNTSLADRYTNLLNVKTDIYKRLKKGYGGVCVLERIMTTWQLS
jgi:myo-inositol-1-phosphate synthase